MDNMGKLFVTLFAFAPAPKTNLQWFLHPDTLICTQFNSLHRDKFLASRKLDRDTAPVLPTSFVTGDKFAAPVNQIFNWYKVYENVVNYVKVASLEGIKENDYNLNIPLYVEKVIEDNLPSMGEALSDLKTAWD